MTSENESQFDYVMASLPGIIIGMIVYVVMVCVAVVLIGVINGDVILSMELLALVGLTVGGSIGLAMLFGAAGGLLALMLLNSINSTLGYVFKPATVIACAGGLAGFVPLSLVSYGFAPFDGIDQINADFMIFALFGPVLATTLGHSVAWWYERTRLRSRAAVPMHRGFPQFRIRHLLVLTTWVALFVVAAQALKSQIPNISLLILFYLVLQSLLFAAFMTVNRYIGARY